MTTTSLAGAVIEVSVGCLLLHAAASKILQSGAALSALGVLRVPRRRLALWSVVGLEMAVGVALCTGWRLEFAVPGAALLLAGLTGGLVVLRLRGYTGDCGCGAASTLLPLPPEFRNALLITALLAAVTVRPEVGGTLGSGVRTVFAALLLASIGVVSALLEARRDRSLTEQWDV